MGSGILVPLGLPGIYPPLPSSWIGPSGPPHFGGHTRTRTHVSIIALCEAPESLFRLLRPLGKCMLTS